MSPKISVLMVTYNHRMYITQAIESVISQVVNFQYELVIGDDHSTDGTNTICRELQKKYPRIIRFLEREHNLGITNNFCSTLNQCNGQYLAILEGDDYWTDQHKLQKQVDFIEEHQGCSLVFHCVDVISGVDDRRLWVSHSKEQTSRYFTPGELIMGTGSLVPTPSMMFRGDILRNLPEWFFDAPGPDYALVLLALAKGDVFFMKESMAAYRRGVANSATVQFANESFNMKIYRNQKLLATLNGFDKYTNFRFQKNIRKKLNRTIFNFLLNCLPAKPRRWFYIYIRFGKYLNKQQHKKIWASIFPRVANTIGSLRPWAFGRPRRRNIP